ncbi:MAG: nitrate reductase subunit beta [Deltaproteobacteria bacterium]
MNVKAQIAMVLNLDKCLGCHTCSIPCKHTWTNRPGTEYMWFNDVETKPGIGYPRQWENQALYRGGWESKDGRLRLKAGGRIEKLLRIFRNPDLPNLEDYYDPWTFDYEILTESPLRKHQPSARSHSLITGQKMEVSWGPNWEDDLAGVHRTGAEDVNFRDIDRSIYLTFRNVFMFYLPRICEHCLNPACVASCPSGALYKRDEDGIVLVDQETCRGWRYCVSGCPYKKVYFNWAAGRSEKCLFCYPRIEAGLPTLCAETCVGRIRYIGVLLYDADRIRQAASTVDDRQVYHAHLELLLDPNDPDVVREAKKNGIPDNFIEKAQASPVYKMAVQWRVALPPHPEFRTLPMVWYVPPLSPLVHLSERFLLHDGEIPEMRIPTAYIANLLSAGDERPVRFALKRLLAMRQYMRSLHVGDGPDLEALRQTELSSTAVEEMYHLLAVGKHADRYVVPTVRREGVENLFEAQGETGLPSTDYDWR